MKKLNSEIRYQVVKEIFTNITKSPNEINKITKYPKRTVTRYIKKIKEGKIQFRKSGSGRPKIISSKLLPYIGRLVNIDPFIKVKEIKLKLENQDINVTEKTVINYLKQMEYTIKLPKKTLFLNNIKKDNRYKWALNHQKTKWSEVIFSDESTFQMFRNTSFIITKKISPPLRFQMLNIHIKLMFGQQYQFMV